VASRGTGAGVDRAWRKATPSTQVWMIRTDLAEPKVVTWRWRSRRARRPPGRLSICEHRRVPSDNVAILQGGGKSDEGVTVPPDGAKAAEGAMTWRLPGPVRTALSRKGTS
jgi:hypothetical protein